MRAKFTTTSYAILGLLSVRTWTTYELAKQVQRSLNWFWPRAERKLYDEPKRLVEAGLATASRELTGNRPRTVYKITPAGRGELRRWLGREPAPRAVEFEGMLKVFFCDAGSLDQLRGTLSSVEKQSLSGLSELARMATEPTKYPKRRHISALSLQLQFEQERAVLRWARWAQQQVAEWSSASNPGGWDPEAVIAELARSVR